MFNLRPYFLLDSSIIFLNHGSFGATPRPVFRAYQRWQRELERQPVEFLGRRHNDLMAAARAELAAYLGTSPANLVYTTNVTVALNIVARSLDLGPGDEVLTTDHEYGALDRTWRFLAQKRGFSYRRQPIPVPLTTSEAFVEALWQGVTPRTRVIFLSHITSPTALIFPVEAVVHRARREGILTVIDGAHAPGQVSLRLDDLGADFYGGNLHKWLCAPKGAGFLYARPEVQPLLEPLVVSWGWEAEVPGPSRLVDYHEWQGTRDIAAFLAVPEAIRFQQEHDWPRVQAACHELARRALEAMTDLTGLPPLSGEAWFGQFVSIPLPEKVDLVECKRRLYEEYRIEAPLLAWNEYKLLRVSFQGYNSERDLHALLRAMWALLDVPTPDTSKQVSI